MSVRLKICGITRPEDLRTCAVLGVDAIGVNLWPGSPRGLDLPRAREQLATALPPGPQPLRVGVFVDPEPAFVTRAVAELGLDLVQLHGDAPVEPYARLGHPYVWVIRGTPALAELRVPEPAPRWVLLDAAVPGYGGAGRTTDWDWARAAVAALAPLPVWLAGGIAPGNVADALARVGPAGIDVASGAEPDAPPVPGAKDRDRIVALLAACRG